MTGTSSRQTLWTHPCRANLECTMPPAKTVPKVSQDSISGLRGSTPKAYQSS